MAVQEIDKTTTREQLLEINAVLRAAVAERDKKVAELDTVIELERAKYEVLQRMFFGRKSERVVPEDPSQGLLFNEAECDDVATPVEESVQIIKRTTSKRGGRSRPAVDLERVEVLHDLSAEDKCCPWCGEGRKQIGEERSEEIEIIPARVVVTVHVRPKYGPCSCEDFIGNDEKAIIIAPAPAKIAPGSMFSNHAAAFFTVSKFADALPFYRQEKIVERMGIHVSRGAMGKQMIRIFKRLTAFDDAFKRDISCSTVLRMDETVVQVLKEDGRPPSSQSRMWVAMGYRDTRPLLYFAYHDSRSGDVAEALVGSKFSGLLQTDGYAGYIRLGKRPGIVHVGCWAHIRREFHKLYKSDTETPLAAVIIKLIGKLYSIERRLRDSYADGTLKVEDFLTRRKEETAPAFAAILAWLHEQEGKVPPRSPLGQAISYALGQYNRAKNYVDHILLTPDNNLIENAIRPFVVGRKNWHFFDSPAGATASAFLYSLIETAKANGHEPYRYLCYLFDNFPLAESPEACERLLPYRLKPGEY